MLAVTLALSVSSMFGGAAHQAEALPVTVNPIEYMINTSGYTMRDPASGSIQKTIVSGDTFWYLKNPWDGRRWERYRYDEDYIWLERDMTWPDGGGNTSYDLGPWGNGKIAPTYNWTVGHSFTTETTVTGFNFLPSQGTTCSYSAPNPISYWNPVTRTLVYHNSALNMGGDIGVVDVIVIQAHATGSETNPYMPQYAERFWYAKGYGWVRWQSWANYHTDSNFSNVTAANPDIDIPMTKTNGSAPSFQDACQNLYPTGTALYSVHQENFGWLPAVAQGAVGGIENSNLRAEGFTLTVTGMSVQYRAWVPGVGWQSWVSDGALAGTEAMATPMEAIQVQLVSPPTDYHIEYKVYLTGSGWTGWVRDGASAGTGGSGVKIEAVKIRVVKDF